MDRSILLSYKHKTTLVDADGTVTSTADLNFFIDEVSNAKAACDWAS